jgi:hypothetical protein
MKLFGYRVKCTGVQTGANCEADRAVSFTSHGALFTLNDSSLQRNLNTTKLQPLTLTSVLISDVIGCSKQNIFVSTMHRQSDL